MELKKSSLFLLLFIVINILKGQKPIEIWINNYHTNNKTYKIFFKTDDLQDTMLIQANANDLKGFSQDLSNYRLELIKINEFQYAIVQQGLIDGSIRSIKEKENLSEKINSLKNASSADLFIFDKQNKQKNSLCKITGTVFEPDGTTFLIGGIISTESKGTLAVTDENGEFSFNIESGEYVFNIDHSTFASKSISVIALGDGYIRTQLEDKTQQLNEVVVTEKSNNEVIKNTVIGLEKLSVKQIKKLPSLMGQVDILKSLTILAGVSSNADGIGGINVRGGNADQNLIVQDGIAYYNPNHAIGFVSLFNGDITSGVQLYKGYIPPEYGGRISSVVSSNIKNGNKSKWKSKINLGLSGSSFFTEGPLIKEKTSILLSGRLAHANWLLKLINLPDAQKSRLNFYDGNMKIDHKISNNSSIGIQGYFSNDVFNLLNESQFDYTTSNGMAYYKKTIGATILNLKIGFNSYLSNLNDLKIKDPSLFTSSINGLQGKLNFSTTISKKSNLNYGLEYNQYNVLPGKFSGA
ncbi:MAG: hypothetical protein RLZZ546_787, partial [Bacteroidota bacterium]